MKETEKIEVYKITADNVPVNITITTSLDEFTPLYIIKLPVIGIGSKAILEKVKEEMIGAVPLSPKEALDVKSVQKTRKVFSDKILELLKKELPNESDRTLKILAGFLVHETLGLGTIEFLLNDENLEEIVINSSEDNIWVYHKKYGWLKTNIRIDNEGQIYDYAASIAREIGRSISNLNPLLDAHLITGDRVNATLFPISSAGNTITIRKFRRKPWTITELIENRTVTSEIVSFIWLAMQYEMSIMFSGGTASGKTTFMTSCMPFIPPNQRVISIEDTREIMLPKFLQWVPLTTREPNPEGKGGVRMLDLLVNSLRMRPDRIIVGEVRRQQEAEVLFEAIHTGHSVYATVHADTAEQTVRRLTNPPINLPESMVSTLPLIVVVYRHRRKGIRRILEVSELLESGKAEGRELINVNRVFRWKPAFDKYEKDNESIRVLDDLEMFTGLTRSEVEKDLKEKIGVLNWMVKHGVNTVNTVGKIVSTYYSHKEKLLQDVRKNASPKELLGKLWKEIEAPVVTKEVKTKKSETSLSQKVIEELKKTPSPKKPVKKKSVKEKKVEEKKEKKLEPKTVKKKEAKKKLVKKKTKKKSLAKKRLVKKKRKGVKKK